MMQQQTSNQTQQAVQLMHQSSPQSSTNLANAFQMPQRLNEEYKITTMNNSTNFNHIIGSKNIQMLQGKNGRIQSFQANQDGSAEDRQAMVNQQDQMQAQEEDNARRLVFKRLSNQEHSPTSLNNSQEFKSLRLQHQQSKNTPGSVRQPHGEAPDQQNLASGVHEHVGGAINTGHAVGGAFGGNPALAMTTAELSLREEANAAQHQHLEHSSGIEQASRVLE